MNIFVTSTVAKILGDVEAEALVGTLANTIAEVETETFSHTLGDVETVAPVGTSHHTLAKVEAKTPHCRHLALHWAKGPRHCYLSTLTDTLAELETETVSDTLGVVEVKAMVDK